MCKRFVSATLVAVHKRLPQSGGLQMRTSALSGAKKLQVFWHLWSVRTDKGGWANADKGEGVNIFAILCFMDGLLHEKLMGKYMTGTKIKQQVVLLRTRPEGCYSRLSLCR